jgi:hypothetical protein
VSEASRLKAAAAKSYIENMYRVHAQKHQDRRDRCSWDGQTLSVLCPADALRLVKVSEVDVACTLGPYVNPTAKRQTDCTPRLPSALPL